MKKKAKHLKVVSDNSPKKRTFSDEKAAYLKEVVEPKNIKINYDKEFIEKILGDLDTEIDKILWKNVVRNNDELDKLYKMLFSFMFENVEPLYTNKERQLELFILLTKISKRLSEIEYRIKKENYEIKFSIILYADLFKYPFIKNEDLSSELEEIMDFFSTNLDYLDLPSSWIILFCEHLDYLMTDLYPDKMSDLRIIMLKKFLKEKVRQETSETIECQARMVHHYIQDSIFKNRPQKDVANLLGGRRFDYGINSAYISYLTFQNDFKQNYEVIQHISKKGKLKRFYDKLDLNENKRFLDSIYRYLYSCLCNQKFDYFENIFLIFSKLTLKTNLYSDLMILYSGYATEKRVRAFLHRCFNRDSLLSDEAQKALRRAILKK